LMTRTTGLALAFRATPVSGSVVHAVGFDNDTAGLPQTGFYFSAGNLRAIQAGAFRNVLSGTYTNGTTYDCLTILRDTGAWMLIRGGAFTNWQMALVDSTTAGDLFPSTGTFVALTYAINIRRVYAAKLSQWSNQYANTFERKAVSVNGDTISATANNALIEHTIVAQTGVTQEMLVRRTDDDNCLIIRMDQAASTIRVFERVAGVETERTGGTTARTWVNGTSYRIFVSLYGSAVWVTVGTVPQNDATSSFNAAATGVKVSHAGTDLIAWPVTPPAAALAELDTFFPA